MTRYDGRVLPRAIYKSIPEDFVVDEIPAYEPSGQGDHVYIHFRKRNRTTDEAVRDIVRALGVDRREVGVAGMKDKVAVTTQWISVMSRDPATQEKAMALAVDGVEVLAAKRHGNKLRTGHLHGNRFTIVLRGVRSEAVDDVMAAFGRIERDGVPNAFGVQRFGKFGDTAEKARAWLTGKDRAPGDPRLRRLHFSAWQSAIFNAVLASRVADGTWNRPIDGDLLKKEDTGGLFVCADVQTDTERAVRGELGPTGPIVGDRMRKPERAALELEERIAAPWLEGVDLHRARSLGEGTRRALRLRVTELSVAHFIKSEHEDNTEQVRALRVGFVLPKGAYATTVLANVVEVTGEAAGSTTEAEPGTEEQ